MFEPPSEMHMHDMVKIDTVVFEVVRRGLLNQSNPPPPTSPER